MSTFGGSYVPDIFGLEGQARISAGSSSINRLRHDRIEVWSDQWHAVGMSGYCASLDDALLCVYGDRLCAAAKLPESANLEDVLSWCRQSFMRFCGALCYRDKLILWTDELASCRLFYAFHESGEPVFASEARRLLDALAEPARFSNQFTLRPLPAIDSTVFANVHAVPAGTVLTIERHGGSQWREKDIHAFFRIADDPEVTCLEDARRLVADALKRSVSRATVGLDQACITLSGGVDSSSVAALMRSEVKRIQSYTVGTPYGNEFEPAREVASFIRSEHHELLMSESDLEALLPELISSMETWDPLTLQIAAPVAFLYRELSREARIFLTGYGADLIFAGTLDPLTPEVDLERQIRNQLILTAPTNELSPVFASQRNITVRYPFLTADLLATGLSIRGRLKVHKRIEKFVLRSAVEPILPEHVAWRPKLGIHEGSAMQEMFTQVLGESTLTGQVRVLREIAEEVLLHSSRQTLPAYQGEETQRCAYY